MRYLSVAIVAAVAFVAAPASAQMTDAQKRRALLPSIKAATDCVARETLNHSSIVFSYRFGNIEAVVSDAWKLCVPQLQAVVNQHEELHGAGTGLPFVTGPYRGDLARAVLTRIKGELDRRVVVQDQAEAAEKAAAAQREVAKQENLDRLNRTARTLRNVFYECADQQLAKLVRSAETADVLATAAMTICRNELDTAFEGWLSVARAEGSAGNEAAFREGLRKITRESVLTSAVQLKAGALSPAPSQPASQTSPSAGQPVMSDNVTICLQTMAKAREGKFIEQKKLLEAMLELCRPEIETQARTAFLNAPNGDLATERQRVLVEATIAGRKLIGMLD